MADELNADGTPKVPPTNPPAPKPEGDGQTPGHNDRGEARFKDLLNKLSEKDQELAKERQELATLKAEKEKLSFETKFNEISAKYPYAKDHRADIEESVKKGLTPEDAAILVLGRNNKLVDSETHKKQVAANGTVGGSADTTLTPGGGKPDLKTMKQEDIVKSLRELEAKGELSLN